MNKNIRVIVPIMLCLMLCFYVVGCGSASSGGGGGGSSVSGRSGKLVDPYIVGAIVFVDVNGSGSYDATVTGEMVATTDVDGGFTFTDTPTLGATIRILFQGIHLGITYDAQLKRTVDGSDTLNITPLTTMLANGVTAESIKYVLQHYAGITIEALDVRDDPMSGLDLLSANSIGKIKGAICIYCLMQVISNETGVSGGYFNLASIEGQMNIEAGLTEMGSAVNQALQSDMLADINASVEAIRTTINGYISPLTASIPAATATDIAETAFTITRWVMQHSIDNAPSYDPGASVIASIEGYAGRLGIRYYLLNNRTHVVFTMPSGPYPLPAGPYTFEDLVDLGYIYDQVGRIVTGEISSSVNGYNINYTNGTIEAVF